MKKILYVEDAVDTANAVRIILKKAGHDIQIAENGEEGIKKAKGHFDLILLDVMLPDMSGWDIYQKLKTKKTKFAFLSAVPVSEDRMKQLKNDGVLDYILKPFKSDELVKRVEEMLKSK